MPLAVSLTTLLEGSTYCISFDISGSNGGFFFPIYALLYRYCYLLILFYPLEYATWIEFSVRIQKFKVYATRYIIHVLNCDRRAVKIAHMEPHLSFVIFI